MNGRFTRTEMLFGQAGMEKLQNSRVAVFGVGGVGGYVTEALVRSGIGTLHLIDSDVVSESNLNRQIIATTETIGRYKTEVAKERVLSINPDCKVYAHNIFYLPEIADSIRFDEFDFVVDPVDTVSAKSEIITRAKAAGVPVISSMGTGNKTDPTRLEIGDIFETSVCPLARTMRFELRRRGIVEQDVLWSSEPPIKPLPGAKDSGNRRGVPGSTAFVPAAAGLIIASEVVRRLLSAP
jgi:tRNA A37 threonylcarbamoyladenosine dehydratase